MSASGSASSRRPACGPRGRPRAAPRFRGSSGRRRGAAARPCRSPCRGRAGDGVRELRASSASPRLGPLPDLATHVLALVTDALALVRPGRANRPHLGGRLADLLLVDALHDDLRRRGHLEADPGAGLDDDGVRETDVELERGPAQRGAVADALDLEALLEALRHALDHVRDERPREAVERAVLAALGRARDDQLAVALLDLHPRRHLLRQLAERPVHLHAPWRHRDVHAWRKFDWPLTDSTQLALGSFPLVKIVR